MHRFCQLRTLPAFLLLFSALAAQAQFNASLSGTVEDNTGAVVSGATATLTSSASAAVKTTTSNGQGFYSFSELSPGSYSLVVTANGFEGTTFSDINLVAEQPRNVNVTLKVGAAAQTVTVTANDVPVLDTADASIGTSISAADVTRLPTFGRDPYELLRLTPGTTADSARSGTGASVSLPNAQGVGQSNAGIFQTENQIQLSSAGQRLTSNTFLIDGVSVDSLTHGGSAIVTPNPESVAQISTTSGAYNAELGRNVGAHIQTVTKSGSNDIHGSLFFQYDEPGLNSYNKYGGPNGALPTRVENKQREWAGSIGFPIRKDKLFFFGSYEGVSNANNGFSTTYVPTPQFYAALAANRPGGIINGILNGPGGSPSVVKVLPTLCENLQVATPTKTVPNPPPVCQEVPGGADIGSFAGALGTYLPAYDPANPNAPNLLTGSGLDGVPDVEFAQVRTPARFRGNQFNARVDWNITPKDQFAASAFISKLDQTSADAGTGAQPISNLPFKPFTSSGTLVYIHTFSPSLINEARGNYTRFADNQLNDSVGTVDYGIPRTEIQGFAFGRLYSGPAQGSTTPAQLAQNTYEVRDTIIQTVGSHTLRYGGLIRFEQDNDNLSGFERPDYVFQNLWDFPNDTPVFESLAANPNTGGPANGQRYFRDKNISAFIQHDWKATPNLTLNTGLRWEYFEPLYNKGSRINLPVFGPDSNTYLTAARLVLVNHLFNSNYKNFAPKFGFAYTPPSTNNKLVVSGGFGLSYDRINDGLFTNGFENGPNFAFFGLFGANAADAAANHILFARGSSRAPDSFPINPGLAVGTNPATGLPNGSGEIEVYGAAPHTYQPIVYNFSLQTQYELPYKMVATIAYQGAIGHHLIRLVNQNFLYPTTVGTATTQFNSAYIPTTDVPSNYHGLNLQLEKRFSHGWNVNAFYTYSKSLDQASNEGPGSLSNQTNPAFPATEYGPSDFDVRQKVTVAGNWDLPKYHNGRGVVGEVLTGWQVNGIFNYHTGFPWTPVVGQPSVAFVQSAATINPIRPTQYFGGAHNSCSNSALINGTNFPGGGATFFNLTDSGQPGIGRNSFNSSCYLDADLTAAKSQPFSVAGHEATFRFQANFYNAFNKLNLAPILFGTNEAHADNTQFGLAPAGDAGRVVEFFARIDF